MKTVPWILTVFLFTCFTVTSLRAYPLVFEFEVTTGNTVYNGSTITLAGPSDLTGANDATDLLGFDIFTPTGEVKPGVGVTALLSISDPSNPSLSNPFRYSSTNILPLGTLLISEPNGTRLTINYDSIFARPLTLAPLPIDVVPGTWIMETSAVPETTSTLGLLLLIAFGCFSVHRSRKYFRHRF